jgi:hypothetical protein
MRPTIQSSAIEFVDKFAVHERWRLAHVETEAVGDDDRLAVAGSVDQLAIEVDDLGVVKLRRSTGKDAGIWRDAIACRSHASLTRGDRGTHRSVAV